uniref:Uncharacterized protein n=1 Tax=Rhizophora mucronata TaxID=61149 RepID=A0A2P2PTS2_RHIMU
MTILSINPGKRYFCVSSDENLSNVSSADLSRQKFPKTFL